MRLGRFKGNACKQITTSNQKDRRSHSVEHFGLEILHHIAQRLELSPEVAQVLALPKASYEFQMPRI